MTWILLLTMFASDYRQGSAIHSVHGFKTQAECEAVANAWLKRAAEAKGYDRAFAACIRQP